MKNITFVLFILLIFSCRNQTPDVYLPPSQKDNVDIKEKLIDVNKQLVKKDSIDISNYVTQKGWNVQITETGLRWEVYENGNGKKVELGNHISLEYTVGLLNDKICYSSDNEGVKTFLVGQGGVETGLEEGVLLLREGDRARFILPPYLAHGLVGDGNCIPARASVVYDVKLVAVEK